MDIEQLNQQIQSSVAASTKKICSKVWKLKESKLINSTVKMMDQRRGLEKGTEEHRTLNKRVEKAIRRDLRAHKTRMIQETIEKECQYENSQIKTLKWKGCQR
ncbi:hypothetical protein HHI36_012073 [Cryptolaemus montrouzieri]|uniref:Endonuclease-reverse transcriptase n=1 Tax=Cryptolaemus montrouzieri TaxID=559131 RepID=A0ABD2ND79_9CUCU